MSEIKSDMPAGQARQRKEPKVGIPGNGETFTDTEVKRVVGDWNWKYDFRSIVLPDKPQKESPLLKQIPEKIDGAEKISSPVNPENAAFRLIHIADNHGSLPADLIAAHLKTSGGPLSPAKRQEIMARWKDENSGVENIQSNVMKIVRTLSESSGSRQLYAEGLTLEGVAEHQSVLDKFKALPGYEAKARANRDDAWTHHDKQYTLFQNKKITAEQYQSALKDALEAQRYADSATGPAAARRLYLDGTVNELAPAEVRPLLESVKKLDSEGAPKKLRDLGSNLRESGALYIVHRLEENGDKVGILLHGGGHDFQDNIELWNKANPDMQIALTVIHPAGYKEALKKLQK